MFSCKSCNCFNNTSILSSFASVGGPIDDEEYGWTVVANTAAIGDCVVVGCTGMDEKVLMGDTLVMCGINGIAYIECATRVLVTKGFELLPNAPKVV